MREFDKTGYRECTRCHSIKLISEYYKSNKNHCGTLLHCKDCTKKQKRSYYINNRCTPEERLKQQNWYLAKKQREELNRNYLETLEQIQRAAVL